MRFFSAFLLFLFLALLPAQAEKNDEKPRRLEVLFLGSENLFDHDPLTRFRVIRRALGKEGINFTYSETLDVLTPENLARYDVLLIFANHYTIDKETQGKALLDFARGGGGCVLLHCASGCFRESEFDEYVELLGGQFKSHGTGVFRPECVNHDHPIMKGYEGFEAWDETYEHKRQTDDRTILQKRGEEPWTWVKNYGEGRVFYTASGHDHRTWNLPAYHELVHRAVRWTAGDDIAALLEALKLPELNYRQAKVPKDPENPVGPNNELQLPLVPEESMKMAQVPPGFDLQLFASEPMIANPIALSWDEQGRLWVVEAFDYPHQIEAEKPSDRIKILEDTDHDGRADKMTVFAEGLNICTSVLPMVGGAITTNADEMIFLHDRDGDGRADDRTVLFSGIKLLDTHALVSNLRYGFDDWVYATVGYSGIDTEVGGERHEFQQAVFRFRADGSELEVVQNTSNNTWGLGFTEEGDVVGSTANDNPSWYVSIPNKAYAAGHRPPAQVPAADEKPRLFPITSDYFQNSFKEHSSSGAGHAIYTARRFPEEWWNTRAFVAEPPMHIVSAPTFVNDGTRFEAREFEQNLYASADAWSAPVAAEVGPDGAVWIADWYCPVLNHNVYRPDHQELGAGNAYVTPDRDREHGRVYRVIPEGSPEPEVPELTSASACVAALSDSNLFWRLTAQRLLVAEKFSLDEEQIGNLFALAEEKDGFASLHAFQTLAGLLPTDDSRLVELTKDLADSSNRALAGAALRRIDGENSDVRELLLAVMSDEAKHPLIRKEAALALGRLTPDPTLGGELLSAFREDEVEAHFATALRLACLRHPEGFFRLLLEEGEAPEEGVPERIFREGLEVLEDDKSYLSPGLLALARESDNAVGKAITEAAGASPTREVVAELSESAERGKETYLLCVACHQPEGQGVPGAFPALAGSERVNGDKEILAKIILKGLEGPLVSQGKNYNAMMPGHGAALNDREIADVMNYVRSSWGNDGDEVSEDEVAAVRDAIKDRKLPWKVKELETK